MPSDHTPAAELRRKRDSLVSDIADAELHVQSLLLALGHIDAALRLIQPSAVEALPPAKQRAKRGENSRPILAALHAAGEPLPAHDLARAVIQAHGKPGKRITQAAYDATLAALKDLQRRGMVRSRVEGLRQLWELVRGD